jgi:hypothetical protein
LENQFICCEVRNVDDGGGDDDDDDEEEEEEDEDDKHRPLIRFLIFIYTSIPYPLQSQPGFCSL